MTAVLTLAIPTYNADPQHLIDALDSLVGPVAASGGAVRVVVVDNGSDAAPAAHLRDCAGSYPQFDFVRHDINLGFDRNILRVLDDISTAYTWYFGDDDLLQDGALAAVLRAIAQHPGVGVVLPHASFFSEESELPAITAAVDGEFELLEGQTFIAGSGFTAAALSTFCVSTELMRSADVEFAVGSNWVHFAVLVQLASRPGLNHILFPEAFVAVRRSNSARWFSNFGNQYRSGLTMVGMILEGLQHGVNAEVYEFYRERRYATNLIDVLTLAWPLSLSARREVLAESRRHFGGSARFRFLDIPVLFLPNWVKAAGSGAIRLAGRARRAIVER